MSNNCTPVRNEKGQFVKGKNCIDITGVKFGNLTAVQRVERNDARSHWLCKCDCGNEKILLLSSLKSGDTKSCGCQKIKLISKHGGSRTKLYVVWQGMNRRCADPRVEGFDGYGGRGIAVCEEWKDSFSAFQKWSIENGYSSGLSIDRIDNNKGYGPDNCRWATARTQQNNTRRTRFIEIGGVVKPLQYWSDESGVSAPTIKERLKRGWDPKRAVFSPVVRKEVV